ncbi:hypothetical protein IW262DRAFT_176009 [Armillaria fumosa]|nr:hypothetical protein IW262DRAFT_176009 [Armillaria fumosa]
MFFSSVHLTQRSMRIVAFSCLILSSLNLLLTSHLIKGRCIFHCLTSWKDTVEPSFLGHDIPATLPIKLRPVLLNVQETVHYSLSGEASNNEWSNLTSVGMGFTHLGPDNRLFVAEMFHELHCMRILNLAFARSRVASLAHIHHCLNYLRQQALCSADLTLEPGDFMERDFVLHRTGSMHVCQDWSAVYSIMADTWSV